MTDAAPSVITADPAAPAAPATTVTPPVQPVGEGQPPAQNAAGDGKETNAQDPNGAKAAVGAPEKYEDFTMPEGIEVDKAMMDQFLPVAKELNLTQEQAQKLVDMQTAYVQHMTKANEESWNTTMTDWVKSAKADQEIGGLKFNESVQQAAKALKQFGTPELRAALDATGVGNHPEFIRVFAKIGKAISEDKFHVSNAQAPSSPKSWAETLFPTQKPE
jgi:hypothetical protein